LWGIEEAPESYREEVAGSSDRGNEVIMNQADLVCNALTNQIASLSRERAIFASQVTLLESENEKLKKELEELKKESEKPEK
jgi:predicted RNase H-like nuclease (RuvC/YqgF family)